MKHSDQLRLLCTEVFFFPSLVLFCNSSVLANEVRGIKPAIALSTAKDRAAVINFEATNYDFEDIKKNTSKWFLLEDTLAQITNVCERRDITPQDWAYEALRGLVERYNCLAAYPNLTFQGNLSITRG